MEYLPLSQYAQFREVAARPVAHGTGTVTLAGGVVEDLIQGIRDYSQGFATRFRSRGKVWHMPVVVGCVPWLTHPEVVAALADAGRSGHLLAVIDKKSSKDAVDALIEDGELGFGQWVAPELQYMATADEHGNRPVIGPFTPDPSKDAVLQPVRVVGWRKTASGTTPLLHSKVLLLGAVQVAEGMGEHGQDVQSLAFERCWIGSANWTRGATHHLEVGMWSTDEALASALWSYLMSLVSFSEDYNSETVGPEPDLLDADWDDEAFREWHDEMQHDAWLASVDGDDDVPEDSR